MIPAPAFIDDLRSRGFASFAGVPCSYLTPIINCAISDDRARYVMATNEGDAVATAAGLGLGGAATLVMMQNSGLGNAVNPLTSLTSPFRIPMLLIVTHRGDPEHGDEPQHELMGRTTGALLDLMEIPWAPFPCEPADIAPAVERAVTHVHATEQPYAFLMRKGSVAPYELRTAAAPAPRVDTVDAPRRFDAGATRVTRSDALRRIIARTPTEGTVVIASTGYTGRELFALADRPNHLYMVGSMGCASSLGLGLALARPDLHVIVIDGDGAALMRLGNFATIGAYGGANLTHLVLDNEVHESTGGQFTVSGGVSFARIAAACGYATCVEGNDPALIDALLDAPPAAAAHGPRFGHLKIRAGTPRDLPRPDQRPHEVWRRLQTHLATETVHAT